MATCPECRKVFAVPIGDSEWWYACPHCGYSVWMCARCETFVRRDLMHTVAHENGRTEMLCDACFGEQT